MGRIDVATRQRCGAAILACAGALAVNASGVLRQPGQTCHVHRRRFVDRRVVDRRHHRDHVDRHVDRACRRRHLCAVSQLSVSIPSVITTRAARCSSLPPLRPCAVTRSGRLLHRVVKDVCPNGLFSCSNAASSEATSVVKSLTRSSWCVERKQRRFVFPAKRGKEVTGRLLGIHRLRPTCILPLASTSTPSFTGPSCNSRKVQDGFRLSGSRRRRVAGRQVAHEKRPCGPARSRTRIRRHRRLNRAVGG